jgi:hypothetical protein
MHSIQNELISLDFGNKIQLFQFIFLHKQVKIQSFIGAHTEKYFVDHQNLIKRNHGFIKIIPLVCHVKSCAKISSNLAQLEI